MVRRHQAPSTQTIPRPRLQSITTGTPRLLIAVWMASAAAGLVVAARQPSCVATIKAKATWEVGSSCMIHRTSVGLAVGEL